MSPAAPAAAAGTVREAIASATDALLAAGADSPRLDAELLLADATGRTRTQLAADPDAAVSGSQARLFGGYVRRRVAREPVAYILGRRGFRNLELRTDSRALIPRPETELLVEIALELNPRSVLDVGTGCGAVALAIADELPRAAVVAVDVSAAALAAAVENGAESGLGARVDFRLGTAASAASAGPFDLVVANLPYIPDGDRASLQPEIAEYEPGIALFAGADGLDAIRDLLAGLGPDGAGPSTAAVALEIGAGQAAAVRELVAAAGFGEIEIRPDLAGIDRVVLGVAGRPAEVAR